MKLSRPARVVLSLLLCVVVVASGAEATVAASTALTTPTTPTPAPTLSLMPAEPSPSSDAAESGPNQSAAGPDLGAALTLRHDSLDDRLDGYAVVYRVSGAGPQRRTALLRAELGALETRADQLHAEQKRVLDAYAEDNVSTRDLFVELARIDATARRIDQRGSVVVAQLDDPSTYDLDDTDLRAKLVTLESPVRAHLVTVYVGENPPVTLEAAVSETEYTLAANDGQFVSEYGLRGTPASAAERAESNRRPVDIEAAAEIVADRHPQEWRDRTGYSVRQLSVDLLYVQVEHDGGVIETYVDRPTGAVLVEYRVDPSYDGPAGSSQPPSQPSSQSPSRPTGAPPGSIDGRPAARIIVG